MESKLWDKLREINTPKQLLFDASVSYFTLMTFRVLRTTRRFNHQLADIAFSKALLYSGRASTRMQRFKIYRFYYPKLVEVTILRKLSNKWVPFLIFGVLFAHRNYITESSTNHCTTLYPL